jgi:alpha-tubulin suppressor-like RCC1 family protein/sugar lactone lactonase YvrE
VGFFCLMISVSIHHCAALVRWAKALIALSLAHLAGTASILAATTLAPAAKEISDGRVTYQIAVASDTGWSATTTASWLTLSAASGNQHGNLRITASANTTTTARSATVVIDGQTHTVTQRALGSGLAELWATGENSQGQLGDNRLLTRSQPLRVATGATAIEAGFRQTFYRTTDGQYFATGDRNIGKLGDRQSGSPRSTFARVSDITLVGSGAVTPIEAVATGLNNTYFINSLGTLYGVGSSTSGQLAGTSSTVTPVALVTNVAAVTASNNFCAYIKTDGTLWTFGSNSDGQVGDGTTNDRSSPYSLATNVVAASAGSWHLLYIKSDGTLWAVGDNGSGQLGDGTRTSRSTPVQIATGVSKVFASQNHSLFIKTDGTLWAMGTNSNGELGVPAAGTFSSVPVQVASGVQTASAGSDHSHFVKADGTLWAMGSNEFGALGVSGTQDRSSPVQVATDVTSVDAGAYHTVYLTASGEVWTMGETGYGQLGDNTFLATNTPLQVASDVTQASISLENSGYISSSGQLFTTGNAVLGKLADGSVASRTQFANVGTATQIVFGSGHTLFLKADATLWGCGFNSSGELGQGNTSTRTQPVQIATNVRAMAAGSSHTVFLKTDNTLWGMGRNLEGQLGDGTTTNRTVPVQIATDVKAVAAGYEATFFIKNDNTLWAMGDNSAQQLGDGTNLSRTTPVQIATDVAAVAAGYTHALYLKNDGTVRGMGSRGFGALGTNAIGSQVTIPVPKARAIAAGYYLSAVLTQDGALWTMGNNEDGQLGDGSNTSRSSPVHVASNVDAVFSTSYSRSLMFIARGQIAPGVPRLSSSLSDQTITAGNNFGLAASANSASAVTWRWQVSSDSGATWNDLAGATTADLSLNAVTLAQSGSRYRAVATNATGVSVTNAATLTVAPRVFPNPLGIVADSSGNLFISDGTTNTIRKVTPAGEATILAGAAGEMGSADGTSTAARFRSPSGLALDADGNLYVADTGNSTIRKITPAGVVTTLAGAATSNGDSDGTGSAARFSGPSDLALGANNTLYVADSGNHTIRQVTSAGVVTTLAGVAGAQGSTDGDASTARFNNPKGITTDATGKIYVSDTTNNTIRAITLNPVSITTLAGLSGVTNSSAVYHSNSLIIAGQFGGVYSTTAPTPDRPFDVQPAIGDILLNGPTGLIADGAQSLRVADTGNASIVHVDLTQSSATRTGLEGVAGHRDGTNPMFTGPRDITKDVAGNLYIADTGNSAIRKITPAGTVSTLIITEVTTPPSGGNPGTGGGGSTPPPANSGGGGGGGGAPSAWFLAVLAALSVARLRAHQRSRY